MNISPRAHIQTMKRIFLLFIFPLAVLLLSTLAVSPQSVAAGHPTPVTSRLGAAINPALPHASDHILVKLTPGTRPAPGFRHIFGDWYRVPVPAGKSSMQAVITWADHDEVLLTELDYLVQVWPPSPVPLATSASSSTSLSPGFIPNDPLFGLQWNFTRVQAPTAWESNTGVGVVVAVLDSGVSRGSDLACRTFVDEYNALSQSSGPGVAADDLGHGTHVAGTIAQCTNNGMGVAGIAYNVQLMPVKVLDNQGYGTFSDIADGFDWARSHGADVINLSVGGPCYNSEWPQCSNSILNEAIQDAADADIVIVGAAGNFRQATVAEPANHPAVIAVAATNFNNGHPPYSNRGSALSVSAPGGDINEDTDGDGVADRIAILQQTFEHGVWGYYYMDGTSMAAPHVSAAAALLRSQAPTASRLQIQQILESTALDLGVEGFDTTFGYGLIQLDDALQAISAQFPTATPSPSASPTATPSLTGSPTPTRTPTSTPTPTATRTPTSTPTLTPSATPSPSRTPTATFPPQPALWLPLLWQGNSLPPSPTLTPTLTPTATPTVIPICSELLRNGSFETPDAWHIVTSNMPARYVQQPVHTGQYAMMLGQRLSKAADSRHPAAEATPVPTSIRSAVYQTLLLPDTSADLWLSFWYQPGSALADGDWQKVWLLDARTFQVIAEIMNTLAEDTAWLSYQFDLTPYAGQEVAIYFDVNNNDVDDGRPTWMVVDDVSIWDCVPSG